MAIDVARSWRECITAHAIRFRYAAIDVQHVGHLIRRRRRLEGPANRPGVMYGDGTS
jgi:hypothetical protein